MIISYEKFINDVNIFDIDNYLKNKESDFVTKINEFNNIYKIIEEEEKKKYNQNNIKFKKFFNDKNNKFSKISRDLEKPEPLKKILSFDTINNENEKLSILIMSYLNKISDDTFEKISNDLIKELININNIKMFEILSEQITNKCILDFKYRHLYILLCSKIWNNKEIHLNLINIEKNDKLYTWNIIDDDEIHGPYENENYMKNIILKKINFKKYFLNYLSRLYKNKEVNIQNLDDDDFFIKKKKIVSLIELISILYVEKYINFDIINLIFIDLLHLNNNFKIIEEIEFELINLILKNINKNKSNFKFNNFKNIINEFISILNNILQIEDYNTKKRSKFFITDNINLFNSILNNNNNNDDKNKKNNSKVIKKENFEETLIKKNILNSLKIFNKLNVENKILSMNKIIDDILQKKKNIDLDFYCEILKSVKDQNEINLNIENYLNKILDNVEDIYLDIPDIISNLKYLLNSINLYNKYSKILSEKEQLLNDHSSDDEDNF